MASVINLPKNGNVPFLKYQLLDDGTDVECESKKSPLRFS